MKNLPNLSFIFKFLKTFSLRPPLVDLDFPRKNSSGRYCTLQIIIGIFLFCLLYKRNLRHSFELIKHSPIFLWCGLEVSLRNFLAFFSNFERNLKMRIWKGLIFMIIMNTYISYANPQIFMEKFYRIWKLKEMLKFSQNLICY